MENKTVILTGSIPQCPYCEKPTQRNKIYASTTLLAYSPKYNDRGEDITRDPNTIKEVYTCNECGNNYSIKGNNTDGYEYNTN